MSDGDKYLYAIMHPNEALVASMLPPAEFGKHYTVGSSRYFHSQVVFAEIDTDYRNDYFPVEEYLEDLVPKADGTPKRTKFIKTYRVLEHIGLDAFQSLYITSSVGKTLQLEKQDYEGEHESGWIRTFQEMCPHSMILLTYMDPHEFGSYITDAAQPKGAPKMLFTQIDFHTNDFLRDLEADPFLSSPIPNVHPHKLREQVVQLKNNPHKGVKGISLDSVFGHISFLRLRTGFWIAGDGELIYWSIPGREVLEAEHYEWLRSLTQ